jgi:hypothetical protein
MSAALTREVLAQTPRETFATRAATGPVDFGGGSLTTRQAAPGIALQSVAAQAAAEANVVNDWNATAVNVILTDAAVGAAEAFLYIGFVQAAVYNAVNGITRRYSQYKSTAQAPATASPRAAAAAAAHRVLMTYYGHVPAAVTRLTEAYATSVGALPNDPSTTAGIQFGRQTAERIIAMRAEDGRYGPNTFDMPLAPGVWRPTPPANAPFFAKFLSETTPLMIDSPTQFRPVPPPALTSAEYAADFEEVKAFGSKEGSSRTPLQTETGLFISSVAGAPLHAGLRDLTVRREMDISDRARLFAAVSMSIADAIIACWDCKVLYGLWRPSTAIQLAEEDGNPATTAVSGWEPLIPNPAYADYSSGLNAVIGSAGRALTRVLGSETIDLTLTSPVTNTTRTYEVADQMFADAVNGRVWVGIHFRFADTVGMSQGQQVADWSMDRYFRTA